MPTTKKLRVRSPLQLLGTTMFAAAASAFSPARRPAVAISARQYIHSCSSPKCTHFSRPHHSLLSRRGRYRATTAAAEFASFSSLRLSSKPFELTSNFEPSGDQPQAIDDLVRNIQDGERFSVLRGATGTGKTFVMGHAIARLNRPTLVLCHNKTLAAQLARELKSFLGNNAVDLCSSSLTHVIAM